MKLFVLSMYCSLIAFSGCHNQPATRLSARGELPPNLDGVIVADGISESEAKIIADHYSKNIGCGGFRGVRDGGSVWIVYGNVGIAAKPTSFQIDKTSGKLSSP